MLGASRQAGQNNEEQSLHAFPLKLRAWPWPSVNSSRKWLRFQIWKEETGKQELGSEEHNGHKNSGVSGTGSFRSPSVSRAWDVPEHCVYKFLQKRSGLPGVQAQAYRPTGGTSSSQRQQEHLTPEITRW